MTLLMMPPIQESGCLENQAKPGCCLEVNINTSGSPVYMEPVNGQVKQMWTAEIASGEITSGIGRMKSEFTTSTNQPLCLDIAWADIDLIIDHISANAQVKDYTLSQTWRFTMK